MVRSNKAVYAQHNLGVEAISGVSLDLEVNVPVIALAICDNYKSVRGLQKSFSTYTRIWGLPFHKNVPRGNAFRGNLRPY
jgi:hypothetical protein